MTPASPRSLLADLAQALLAQRFRTRLSAFETAETPEGDGGGVLALIGKRREVARSHASRLIDDELRELVQIARPLNLHA